jgi:PPOX class probable FMN-dependent enzyme
LRTIRSKGICHGRPASRPAPHRRFSRPARAVRPCRRAGAARDFIARSPFLCIATADARGRADVSPRGDKPGFVHVLDDHHLAIPDRPGNNRLDTMVNIVENPNVGLIFMIPGFEDTLRINGRAEITADPAILARAEVDGKRPKTAIRVKVAEQFFHCAKAFRRARLWQPDAMVDRKAMPTLARIILEQTEEAAKLKEDEILACDAAIEENYRTELY